MPGPVGSNDDHRIPHDRSYFSGDIIRILRAQYFEEASLIAVAGLIKVKDVSCCFVLEVKVRPLPITWSEVKHVDFNGQAGEVLPRQTRHCLTIFRGQELDRQPAPDRAQAQRMGRLNGSHSDQGSDFILIALLAVVAVDCLEVIMWIG